MPAALATDPVILLLRARAATAGALSQALTDPRQRRLSFSQAEATLLRAAWNVLGESQPVETVGDWGLGELTWAQADIEPVVRWLSLPAEIVESAYVALFGLTTPKNFPPYETEYLHWTDPTYRSHQMADIAGFFRAFGLDVAASRHDRHDHIALEIEFIAFLLRKLALVCESTDIVDPAHAEICERGLASFLHDHLAWWATTFARDRKSVV